jgi:antitoxin YefM
MKITTASEARTGLFRLIGDVCEAHEPIVITSKKGNAVLISEEDWSSIQETLYLHSIPGMAESIKEGMNTADSECISLDEFLVEAGWE